MRRWLVCIFISSLLAAVVCAEGTTLNIEGIIGIPTPNFFPRAIPYEREILILAMTYMDSVSDQEIPLENQQTYAYFVGNGPVKPQRIEAFLKNHYLHLAMNAYMADIASEGKLNLPFDIAVSQNVIASSIDRYKSYVDFLKQHFVSRSLSYSDTGYRMVSFREFFPLYQEAVKRSNKVLESEQEFFEYFELLMVNREDPYSLQDSLNEIKRIIHDIQAQMPYGNVPDHLWTVLLDCKDMMYKYLPDFNLYIPEEDQS